MRGCEGGANSNPRPNGPFVLPRNSSAPLNARVPATGKHISPVGTPLHPSGESAGSALCCRRGGVLTFYTPAPQKFYTQQACEAHSPNDSHLTDDRRRPGAIAQFAQVPNTRSEQSQVPSPGCPSNANPVLPARQWLFRLCWWVRGASLGSTTCPFTLMQLPIFQGPDAKHGREHTVQGRDRQKEIHSSSPNKVTAAPREVPEIREQYWSGVFLKEFTEHVQGVGGLVWRKSFVKD